MKKLLTFLLTALLAFSVGWAETSTLTNANIVNAGTAKTGYQSWSIPDGNGKTWSAYAIKNYHSNATIDYHYLQIRKFGSSTAYYIQVPEFGTKITQIVMTVSSSSQTMNGGGNSATLYFSSSNSTSATGTGVASGTGASSVTIDCSSLNLNTGYITASAAVRIWDITVTYESGSTPPAPDNWYRKVTNADELIAGTKSIIVYENGSTVVGFGDLNGSRYATGITGLTVNDNKTNIADKDVLEFTLGGDANGWTLHESTQGYLRHLDSGEMNFAFTTSTPQNTEKWIIDVNNGRIRNKYSNKYIYYDINNTYFYIYTTLFSNIRVFVKDLDAPEFSSNGGTFTGPTEVTITGVTGSTIYYTTDGNAPTTSSNSFTGSGSVTITESCTLKAIAVKDDASSPITSADFSINSGSTPSGKIYQKITSTNDLTDGNYLIVYETGSVAFDGSLTALDNANNNTAVIIETSGSTKTITTSDDIYFTYNSSEGTLKSASGYYIGQNSYGNGLASSTSEKFVNQISFNSGNAIIEGAGQSGGSHVALKYNKASDNLRFRYYKSGQENIQLYKDVTPTTPKVATPTFSPEPGTYTSAQTVTISSATQGATIAYTYNGGSVQTGTAPVSLYLNTAGTTVIEAYATLAGYVDSDPVTATYTIDLTPTLTVAPTELSFGTIAGDQLTVTTSNLTAGVNASVLNTDYNNINTDKWTVNPNTLGTDGGTMTVNYGGRLLKSDNTVRVSTTTNGVANVDVPVHYKHSGPIYIVTSSTNWDFSDGIEMNHSGDVYSYTLNATTETYLVFTKKVGNDVDWNSGYLFGPVASGDWWLTEESMDTDFAIDSTAYHVVKMHNGTYTITLNAATNKMRIVADVHAPVFSHEGGRYYDPIDVEITSDTYGAHIYYTLDGSEPSANNGTMYTGPVTISDESTTLKAVAIYGDVTSPVTTATYTIKPQGSDEFELVTDEDNIMAGEEYVLLYISGKGKKYAMTENHNGSQYASTDEGFTINASVVTLEDPTSVNVLTLKNAGNSLFYIQDQNGKYLYLGSNSNVVNISDNYTDNAQYKWSITLSGDSAAVITNTSQPDTRYLQCNASASAYACYKSSSSLYNASLYMRSAVKVPAPQITPAGGTSNKRFESVNVTITAAEGCRIYYTTDGSAPSVNSTEYTGVFVLPYGSAPTTVKAIAVDGEGKVSRVTTVVYYWDRVQVSISPASKEVVGNVDVTITPSPSDATVTYTINGGEPQTYNGPFTVQVNEENTPVTVEATAVKGESTATASVTYTYKDGGVNSIAEFLALDNNEERFFKNPVVVLFDYSQNGDQDYIWVKDRTGYMKLFIQPGFDEDTSKPRYNNGDVIPEGFTVKKITYTEHDASFIEGKSEDPSLDNFKNPTERALADPEQVKLSELLANPAVYNDRYLYINKLEITGHGGTNYYVASDENNDNTSEVSGNNVIIYNKFPTWNEKDGTNHTVTIPSADGTYYNVKFIFQKYGSVYEIMPIEFTPWVENKVRLEDLVKIGVKDNPYTISNELVAVKVTWDDNQKKFAIFAKDDEAYAEKRYPADGQEEYLIRYERKDGNKYFINEVPQKDYDQSNWLEILIPSNITSKQDGLYQNQLATLQERYENKILPGSSVQGTYVDVLNPTIEMASEIGGDLKGASYDPNIFFTGNFVMENLGENGAVSYNQANDGTYFMMDAKPQEFCMVVWAYYEGSGNYFIAPEPEGAEINGHGFHGSFLADMSLCEDIYGLESAAVNKGTSVASCFKASDDESYGSQQMLYGFKAIVRKNPDYWNAQGGNGAPSRIQPYSEADGNAKEGNPAYKVYPMSVGSTSSGNVTDVNEVNAIKAVVSVRYYNVMGMESEKPFEGINIVVTRYSDGSASTVKVLR